MSRWGQLEIDEVTSDTKLVPTPAPIVRGSTVDESEKARVIADAAHVASLGFNVKETVVPIGTLVTTGGVAKFTKSRREFDAMPHVSDACETFERTIALEDRRDLECTTGEIKAHRGMLSIGGKGDFSLTSRGVKSLSDRVTEGMGYYAGKLFESGDDEMLDLMASNLNFHIDRAWDLDKDGNKEYSEFMARTRKGSNGGREIFAAVGPRYTAHDVDAIAKQISEVVAKRGHSDARCDIHYDEYKATFDVMFHSNIEASRVVAGEYFKAGVRLRTADDGTLAIASQSSFTRNLCRNMIILDKSVRKIKSRRHVGEHSQVCADVETAIDQALDSISSFTDKWNEANLDNLMDRYGVGEPVEIFKRLVGNKVVWVPGMKPGELVDRLMGAYATEPSTNKAGFLNAITKAAHSYTWEKSDTQESLEEKAGSLLYQQNWQLNVTDNTVTW